MRARHLTVAATCSSPTSAVHSFSDGVPPCCCGAMPNEIQGARRWRAIQAQSSPPRHSGGVRRLHLHGRLPRRPLARLGCFAVAAGAGFAALGVVAVKSPPFHALRCAVSGRDGWIVELPPHPRTPDEVRQTVQAQTSCVPVEEGYVNWNLVEEGLLAVPVSSPRMAVESGGTIKVWVEGTAEQASDRCAPLGPRTAPPPGCRGGAQRAR